MSMPRIFVSILNWNKASVTLKCVDSLRVLDRTGMDVEVVVIDNGSAPADAALLLQGIEEDWIRVYQTGRNLGFTGGHNVALAMARESGHDFVWMLNNDTTVPPDTLVKLVAALLGDPRCGAVSPVIFPDDGGKPDNAWGLVHDWATRGVSWMQSEEASRELHRTRADDICLSGTAILLRMQAMCQVGLLDDRLFAYYDDNDIGARLAQGGWRNKVVFDASALHGAPPATARPLYFFYLMFRNELFFWNTNMPPAYRKLLWLKLVNQSLFNVVRLRRRGLRQQADSALLGVWDFMRGRGGAPDLQRKAPFAMYGMLALAERVHGKQLAAAETTSV